MVRLATVRLLTGATIHDKPWSGSEIRSQQCQWSNIVISGLIIRFLTCQSYLKSAEADRGLTTSNLTGRTSTEGAERRQASCWHPMIPIALCTPICCMRLHSTSCSLPSWLMQFLRRWHWWEASCWLQADGHEQGQLEWDRPQGWTCGQERLLPSGLLWAFVSHQRRAQDSPGWPCHSRQLPTHHPRGQSPVTLRCLLGSPCLHTADISQACSPETYHIRTFMVSTTLPNPHIEHCLIWTGMSQQGSSAEACRLFSLAWPFFLGVHWSPAKKQPALRMSVQHRDWGCCRRHSIGGYATSAASPWLRRWLLTTGMLHRSLHSGVPLATRWCTMMLRTACCTITRCLSIKEVRLCRVLLWEWVESQIRWPSNSKSCEW